MVLVAIDDLNSFLCMALNPLIVSVSIMMALVIYILGVSMLLQYPLVHHALPVLITLPGLAIIAVTVPRNIMDLALIPVTVMRVILELRVPRTAKIARMTGVRTI